MEWLFMYFISQGRIYSGASLLLKNSFLSFQSRSKQHGARQHRTDLGGKGQGEVGMGKKEPVWSYFSAKQGPAMKVRTSGRFKLCSALFCCHMLQEETLRFGVLVFFFPFLPLSNPSRVPSALQPHLINIHMHTATFIHARLKEKQISFTFHNKFFSCFLITDWLRNIRYLGVSSHLPVI